MMLRSAPARVALKGEIFPPGDKSISHRALIFASLAAGQSKIGGLLLSDDTLATLKACQQLGASVQRRRRDVVVTGTGGNLTRPRHGRLELGNSGTAMRLLAGVLSAQKFACRLSGDASLNRRPMGRIVDPLRRMGAIISATEQGTAPLHIQASQGLHGIEYASPVASAQIKSCVLLAGLYAQGITRIMEPHLSRDHSERMLPLFGVNMPAPCCVRGGSLLRAVDFAVPGDISSAVFPLAAAALVPGSTVVLRNVGLNPTRDGFLRCLQEMGADLRVTNVRAQDTEPAGDVELAYNGRLSAIDVPPARIPGMIDELPLLMALAATARGTTRIREAAELRVKESDRLAVMASGLSQLGVVLQEYNDGVDIIGGPVSSGSVTSAGDHRCAMSFAILGLRAEAHISIGDAEYISTSYPGFIEDMKQLGADMEAGKSV